MDILSDQTVVFLMEHPESVEPDNEFAREEVGFEAFLEAHKRGLL